MEGSQHRRPGAARKPALRPRSAHDPLELELELKSRKIREHHVHSTSFGSTPDISKSGQVQQTFSEGSLSRLQYGLLPFELLYSLQSVLNKATNRNLRQLALQLEMTEEDFDHICRITESPVRSILMHVERNLRNLHQLETILGDLGLDEAASLVSKYIGREAQVTLSGTALHTTRHDDKLRVANETDHAKFRNDSSDSFSEDEWLSEKDLLQDTAASQIFDKVHAKESSQVLVDDMSTMEASEQSESIGVFQLEYGWDIKPGQSPLPGSITTAWIGSPDAQRVSDTRRSQVDSGIGSSEITPEVVERFSSRCYTHGTDGSRSHLNYFSPESSKKDSHPTKVTHLSYQRDNGGPPSDRLHSDSPSTGDKSFSSLPSFRLDASPKLQGRSSEQFSSLELSFGSSEIEGDCPVVTQQIQLAATLPEQSVRPRLVSEEFDCASQPPQVPPSISGPIVRPREEACLTQGDHQSVSGLIGPEGGVLCVSNSAIHLRIPPNALTRSVMVYLTAMLDESGCSQSAYRPRIMPLVRCEPDGLEFEVPVELVLPHCGIITESDPKFEVYVRQSRSSKDSAEWTRDDSASASAALDSYGSRQTCRVMLQHFSDYDVFIRENGVVIGKLLRAFPLVSKMEQLGDDLLLSTWMCNNYDVIYNQINEEHSSADVGVRLAAYREYVLEVSEKSLKVQFNCLNERHTSSPDEDTIGYRHLWYGSRGCVTFRIRCGDIDSGNDLLKGTLTLQQLDNIERIKFEIQQPMKNLLKPMNSSPDDQNPFFRPRPIPTQQSIPGESGHRPPLSLDATELYIPPSQTDGNHIHINLSPSQVTPSEAVPGHTMFPMSPPTFWVNHSLAMDLTFCLDTTHALGKDWQLLAEKLGYKPLEIEAFGREKYHTKELLDTACKGGRLHSLDQLRDILERMERIDAVNVLDEHLGKQKDGDPTWHPRNIAETTEGNNHPKAARQVSHPFHVDDITNDDALSLACAGFDAMSGKNGVASEDSQSCSLQNFQRQVAPPGIPCQYEGAEEQITLSNSPGMEDTGGSSTRHGVEGPPEQGSLDQGTENTPVEGSIDELGEEHGTGENPDVKMTPMTSYKQDPSEQGSDGEHATNSRNDIVGGNSNLGENEYSENCTEENHGTAAEKHDLSVHEQALGPFSDHAKESQGSVDRDCSSLSGPSNDPSSEYTPVSARKHVEQHDLFVDEQAFSPLGDHVKETGGGVDKGHSTSLEPLSEYRHQGASIGASQSGDALVSGTASSKVSVVIPDDQPGKYVNVSDINIHSPLKTPDQWNGEDNGSDVFIESPSTEEILPVPFSLRDSSSSDLVAGEALSAVDGLEDQLLEAAASNVKEPVSLPVLPLHTSTPNKASGQSDGETMSTAPQDLVDISNGDSVNLSQLRLALSKVYPGAMGKSVDSGFSSPVLNSETLSRKSRRRRHCMMAPNFGNGSSSIVVPEPSRSIFHAQISCSSNDSGVVVSGSAQKHTTSSEEEDVSGRFSSVSSYRSGSESGVEPKGCGVATQTSPQSETNDKGLHSQSSSEDSGIAQESLGGGEGK